MIRLLIMCSLAVVFCHQATALEDEWLAINQRLFVHWPPEGGDFWMSCQTNHQGRTFLKVDARTGLVSPAFDHELMATALSKALGKKVSANVLPIVDLEWDPAAKSIRVRSEQSWFHGGEADLDLKPYVASGPHLGWTKDAGQAAEQPASLEIVNRSPKRVILEWRQSPELKQLVDVPDGQRRRQSTYTGHLWTVRDGARRVLATVAALEGHNQVVIDHAMRATLVVTPDPNRSPDGKWRVAIRDYNIWLTPVGGGADVPLTTDGSEAGGYVWPIRWSPDSSHVAARFEKAGQRRTITLIESSPRTMVKPGDQESKPQPEEFLQPRTRAIRYDKPGDRIHEMRPCLLRVADQTAVAIDGGLLEHPWSVEDLAWNADSSGFTLLFNQRGHQVMRVVEVRRDGTTRAVIEERSPTFIDYAGKSFFQRVDQGRSILWMSERDGWNHLYRYDVPTGQVKSQITTGTWAVRSVEHVDEEAGLIWFTAGGMVPGEDPYHVHHCRVAFDGSGQTRLTDGDGTHSVQWSPDRRWFIDTWSRVDLPPQHVLRDGLTGKLVVELGTADISALRATGWQQPERFVAKGRDGTSDIHGVLWRPKDFDPAKRYPLVEDIYAGPHAAHVPKAFRVRYRQQDIADLGFIVGMVDCLGTSQRSKAFHDVCWKNLADAGFPDRIPWWKAAASTRPWMDLSRVGIYGGSAGGQSAMGALLFHPEFYHVAVADCGCHDNRMDKIWWNELWMGWPVGPHYAEQSNVTNAHKLQGKLMLIVGEIDDNVDPQSTHQVAHALEKAGKDFELVVVHGQGHGAAETPFGKKKRAGFLVRHLGGPKE